MTLFEFDNVHPVTAPDGLAGLITRHKRCPFCGNAGYVSIDWQDSHGIVGAAPCPGCAIGAEHEHARPFWTSSGVNAGSVTFNGGVTLWHRACTDCQKRNPNDPDVTLRPPTGECSDCETAAERQRNPASATPAQTASAALAKQIRAGAAVSARGVKLS